MTSISVVTSSSGVEDFDVVVVGAGTGGLGAARAAKGARRRVALVEQDRAGGDCTWYGCVPSKTLIETARTVHHARSGAARGIRSSIDVDFAAVMEHVRGTREIIYGDESPAVLRRQGIPLVVGHARFVERDVLEVAGPDGVRRLRASRFVLATGGQPFVPDVPGLAGVPYLTNETVWDLTTAPEHLAVLGGGPIGCELAQAFRRLDCRVTLLQRGGRLLPHDEPAAGEVLRTVFAREGVDVRLHADVVRVEQAGTSVTLHLADGSLVEASHVLVSAGRRPRTCDLGLDVAGVAVDAAGRVDVDRRLRSRTADHVYAVGDCASALRFTHVADDQARLAVRNLLFGDRPGRFSLPGLSALPGRWSGAAVPWVTFTDPEVAHVGLTEAAAYARHGVKALVARVPLAATDRARCAGETDGFVQLVAAPGLIDLKPLLTVVGMTVVAPAAGEMLSQGGLAVALGTPVRHLATTTAAYPTWSIATRIAAALFFSSYGGRSARPATPDPAD